MTEKLKRLMEFNKYYIFGIVLGTIVLPITKITSVFEILYTFPITYSVFPQVLSTLFVLLDILFMSDKLYYYLVPSIEIRIRGKNLASVISLKFFYIFNLLMIKLIIISRINDIVFNVRLSTFNTIFLILAYFSVMKVFQVLRFEYRIIMIFALILGQRVLCILLSF
jgi:hypothetical protein